MGKISQTPVSVVDADSVSESLSGATISTATVASNDKVLIQDTDDSDNLKTVTAQSIADLGGGAAVEWMSVIIADGSGNQTIGTSDVRIEFDEIFDSSNSGSDTTSISLDTTTNVGEITLQPGTYTFMGGIYPAGVGNGSGTTYIEGNDGGSDFQITPLSNVDYDSTGDPAGQTIPVMGTFTCTVETVVWLQCDSFFSANIAARRVYTQLTVTKIA